MDIRRLRRSRALAFSCVLPLVVPATAPAATLAAFSFDAGTQFTATPSSLALTVDRALWRDDAGPLGSLAGNPGRALATSGFTHGNALHLTLTAVPGFTLVPEHLLFDVRVSASGPSTWVTAVGATELGRGAATTAFRSFDLALQVGPAAQFQLDFRGLNAGASSGTLRLDNVRVDGRTEPVPLPGGWFLLLTPTLGGLLRAGRLRYWPGVSALPTEHGHACQASSSGKYSPSMIGRGSRLAMMRP